MAFKHLVEVQDGNGGEHMMDYNCLPHDQEAKERKKGPCSHNPLQGHTSNDLKISHLLQVLPSPNSATLVIKPLTYGPLENI
jgi:hypothetical protein